MDEALIAAHLGLREAAIQTSLQSPPASGAVAQDHRARPSYFFSAEREEAWLPPLRALLLRRFAAELPRRPLRRRPLLVLKEPHGGEAADLLFRVLPKAKLLLLRDGRDVVDSVLDATAGGWGGRERAPLTADERATVLHTAAEWWVVCTQAVLAAYERLPPDQRLLVRYEELRGNAAVELRRTWDWLGLEGGDARAMAAALDFEQVPASHRGPGRFHRAATPGL